MTLSLVLSTSLALAVVFIIILGHYSFIEVLARERKDRRRAPSHTRPRAAREYAWAVPQTSAIVSVFRVVMGESFGEYSDVPRVS